MIEFRVKMRAPSTPNLREHYMARATRVKAQRGAVQREMPKWPGGPLLVVRITRVAPRALDGDNLQTAAKAIRDQIAVGLRIDDASPLVDWEYHQTKGEAEVVVQIWRTGEIRPPLPVGRTVERTTRHLAPGTGEIVRSKRARPGLVTPRGRMPRSAYTPLRSKPVDAAKEAEETFAAPPVQPCDHCGEEYRAACFDPKAPPRAVKCRKDVHCYQYDGHEGDCESSSPRACAT